ncbi:MAG TPA: hypothetical protein VKY41_07820 [Xanthomarina sp.]|nr:hypothetical protein [Xanthomarina sp.]
MGKKKQKKEKKKALKELQASGIVHAKKVKSVCCEKYKKKESKRCKKCPCFDLINKVA